MRRRLTKAITVGLSLAGCSDRAISDTNAGGTQGDATSTSDGTVTSTTGTTTTVSGGVTTVVTVTGASDDTADTGDNSDDTNDDDDFPSFDVGTLPDVSLEPDRCAVPPPPPGLACAVGPADDDPQWVSLCVPLGRDGACAPETDDEIRTELGNCTEDWDGSGGDCGGLGNPCGPPTIVGEDCCYWAPFTGPVCPGRPFLVEGRERIAPLVLRADWCDAWADAARNDLLARAWLFDARNEHAAIASFARFAMQLLALGAPPRFVEGALQAASDEREHATLFFGLARACGGAAFGPGPLDVHDAMTGACDPIAIVVATVHEGCIAETISMMQLQRASETAEKPQLRAALARVLEQEMRHVELAWSFVAWACARGDDRMRAAVRAAFAEAERWIPRGPDVEPEQADANAWRRCGRQTHDDARAVAARTLRTIVGPAARELLGRVEVVAGEPRAASASR